MFPGLNIREAASRERNRIHRAMAGRQVLDPTSPRTIAEALWHREQAYVPGLVWTPVWTEEARKAYYGL